MEGAEPLSNFDIVRTAKIGKRKLLPQKFI